MKKCSQAIITKLVGLIDDKIKKPIAKKMIFESINENTEIMVSYDNDEYTFNTVH